MERNQNGTVLFVALPCIVFILYIGISTVKRQVEDYKSFTAQASNFLCLKRKSMNIKNYMKFMQRTNRAIQAAKIASLVPKSRAIALATLRALKRSQSIKTKSLLFSSSNQRDCRNSFTLPMAEEVYSKNGVIFRNKDETAKKTNSKIQLRISARTNLTNNIKATFSTKGELKLIKISFRPKHSNLSLKALY